MSTPAVLSQPVRRRRLAGILLAGAIAGGIGAALPSTDAQAARIPDPWCQTQGEQIDCAVR